METKIKRRINDLGITPNLNAYNFIVTAVKIIIENPTVTTTEVYRIVSKESDTISSRVERSIRHAITKSYESHKLSSIFDDKPVNSVFLFTIAEVVKSEIPRTEQNQEQEEQEEKAKHDLSEVKFISEKTIQFLDKDNNSIDELIKKYPIHIPTGAIADFLSMDIASVRAAVENQQFGLAWRKSGKANHGYLIPTAQFIRWYLNI